MEVQNEFKYNYFTFFFVCVREKAKKRCEGGNKMIADIVIKREL